MHSNLIFIHNMDEDIYFWYDMGSVRNVHVPCLFIGKVTNISKCGKMAAILDLCQLAISRELQKP